MIRRLRPEEIELWRKVIASVKPRQGRKIDVLSEPAPKAPAKPKPEAAPLREAHGATNILAAQKPPPRTLALDDKTRRDVSRGRMSIEGRLDLHGYRAEEAHHALRNFLRRMHAQDARLVLVVTGKGGLGAQDPYSERGVLRRETPHWLSDRALSDIVAGYSPASDRHGGGGALYVRLKRRRAFSSDWAHS